MHVNHNGAHSPLGDINQESIQMVLAADGSFNPNYTCDFCYGKVSSFVRRGIRQL